MKFGSKPPLLGRIAIACGLSVCIAAGADNRSLAEPPVTDTLVAAPDSEPSSDSVSGIDDQYFSESLRPGDDFYQYVNDGWLENTEIPADRSDYGTFTVLSDRTQEQIRNLIESAAEQQAAKGTDIQKVGDFFRSVTDIGTRNALGTTPLQPLLKQVEEISTGEEFASVLGAMLRNGVAGPMVIYVSPDARRSDQYAIYVTHSGLTLPDRDYYLKDEPRYEELRGKLRDYISRMLNEFQIADASQLASKIFALETELAGAMWSRVQNRDPVKTYNKKSFEQFSTLLSNFSFGEFARAAGVAQQTELIVRQPSYFSELDQMFAEIPLETWKAYLAFRVIDAYASATTEQLEKIHFDFHGTAISGVPQQKPMWKRGVESTERSLGEILGRLYVDQHFSPKAKARMEQLVENLKLAFQKRIKQLDWMGEGTKKQALEKLSMFTTKIGYPDQWKDYSKLDISADDYVGNLLRSARVEYQRDIDKLGGPIDRGEWHMTPQTINAYYNPVMNEIVFPAAILQPPFFNLEADDAVNYGAIGAVIGHEISHGFDDKGSQYDGAGNLRNWWTEEDRSEFDKRAAELVEQYNSYQPFADMNVNGELTLGENIGDLGGLSVAYEAYQLSLKGAEPPVIDGFTGPQRFFLGWSQIWRRKYREPELRKRLLTDPHSPSRYRVNGIVSNMDDFYEAFDIPPQQSMYIAPADRVRIW